MLSLNRYTTHQSIPKTMAIIPTEKKQD